MKQLLEELRFAHLPMMTAFLKEFGERTQGIKNVPKYSEYKYMDLILQPLTKGMFVPCGEDGEVLSEPNKFGAFCDGIKIHASLSIEVNIFEESCKQYKEAKERVIFEGWSITMQNEYSIILNDSDKQLFNFLTTGEVQGTYPEQLYETLEDAINDKVKLKLK